MEGAECVPLDEDGCIHRHEDGSWWFFDETMAIEHGPFDSKELCSKELDKYIEFFNLDHSRTMDIIMKNMKEGNK